MARPKLASVRAALGECQRRVSVALVARRVRSSRRRRRAFNTNTAPMIPKVRGGLPEAPTLLTEQPPESVEVGAPITPSVVVPVAGAPAVAVAVEPAAAVEGDPAAVLTLPAAPVLGEGEPAREDAPAAELPALPPETPPAAAVLPAAPAPAAAPAVLAPPAPAAAPAGLGPPEPAAAPAAPPAAPAPASPPPAAGRILMSAQ